jgi:enterochelin esterase family protein
VQGRAGFILDNLIAEQKAKPMLIVMDNGGGSALFATPRPRPGGAPGNSLVAPNATAPAPGAASTAATPTAVAATPTTAPAPAATTAAPAAGAPNAASPNPGARGPGGGRPPFNFAEFENVLLKDIIPMIDSKYRTMADREHRGMAGLSMGGMQTRNIGLAHLEVFSHIGIFSGGNLGDLKAASGPLANPEEFNRQVKVAFVSYGEAENGSKTLKDYCDSLAAAGIKNVHYYISPHTAHEFLSWRRSLHEFAPLLFQN